MKKVKIKKKRRGHYLVYIDRKHAFECINLENALFCYRVLSSTK